MLNPGVMSSLTDVWGTPQDLFDRLDSEYRFTLDPCANHDNHKCDRYFTESDDGLSQEWTGSVFMNPPYGRAIGKWMGKAYRSSLEGATVVCLVPARTDTAWWHDYAMQGEITFLRGRLKFTDTDGKTASSAPFPSAIVVFRGGQC